MNIKDLHDSLDYLFKAEVTPFVWGHAGIGKSSIVKQYAKEKGYHFFSLYLGTQSDLGDVLGLADFVKDSNGRTTATSFATPEWLRNAIDYCENNPSSGAVLFLDEFNRARRDVLNGIFSLALDKTFHTLKLPKNMHIIAAGNPPTDEYNVTDVNETALMARFVHVKLEPTFEEWVQYATNKKVHSSLVGFLKEQPQLLEESRTTFDLPIKVDRRAYERLNRLFELETPDTLLTQLMQGIIGLERTIAYQEYLKKSDKPLSAEEVLAGSLTKIKTWSTPGDIKASLLNLTTENVIGYLESINDKRLLTDAESSNLMNFIEMTPRDIIYVLISKLAADNVPFKTFYQRPEYEEKMIQVLREAKGVVKKKKAEEKKEE